MANMDYTHNVGAYARDSFTRADTLSSRRAPMMTYANMAGALVSLSLIVGVGVWGYKLLMRDVSGIPVVRAASGEMRELPKDPGGQLAENQGLSVNMVAAEGVAEQPADTLILAPRDIALHQEDQPITAALMAQVEQPAQLPMAEQSLTEATVGAQILPLELTAEAVVPVPETTAALDDTITPEAANEQVVELPTPLPAEEIDTDAERAASINSILTELTGAAPQPANTSTAARVVLARAVDEPQEYAGEILPLAAPGVPQSKRPHLRPAAGAAVIVPAAMTVAQASGEINPDDIPAGTRLAQLGAFDSPEVARSEWDRLQGRFGDYLYGKSRVVQRTESSGRVFYRLRAMGFADLNDAQRFCSALEAEDADCIAVVAK